MLSQTLKVLVGDGFVRRVVAADTPVRVSYELTPNGHEVAAPSRRARRSGSRTTSAPCSPRNRPPPDGGISYGQAPISEGTTMMSTISEAAAAPLDALHAAAVERGGAPVIVRGEGCYVYDDSGKRYLDGLAGLFTVQIGHGRAELAEAARTQSETLAYFPVWGFVHEQAATLARATRARRARRPEPRVLHTVGRRRGRVGDQAVAPVLEVARRADAPQGDLAVPRLSRHVDGRAQPHRRAVDQGPVRAARARRDQGADAVPIPLHRLHARVGVHAPLRRRPRAADRDGGPRDHRRGVHGAGAEHRRRVRAARGLLGARPRDLRPLRRAAGQRRGDRARSAASATCTAASATATSPT